MNASELVFMTSLMRGLHKIIKEAMHAIANSNYQGVGDVEFGAERYTGMFYYKF